MTAARTRSRGDYVVTKALADVTIGPDDAADGPGTFSLILSTDAVDRDGESVETGAFEPLPGHISMDIDHGMSVATTVGSGRPFYNAAGQLQVDGTFASTELGQNVRTLVREGHVRTASVAMIPTVKTKAAEGGTVRITKADLLNGAFTPVPSNTTATVLSAKNVEDLAELKAGARNSQSDSRDIQAIHDLAAGLGAVCGDGSSEEGTSESKDAHSLAETKAKYSADQLRQMLTDGQAFRNPDGSPSYPIADKADLSAAIHAVGRGGADHDKIRAYIISRAKALNASDEIPDNWNADGSTKSAADAAAKAAADAADDRDHDATVQELASAALKALTQ